MSEVIPAIFPIVDRSAAVPMERIMEGWFVSHMSKNSWHHIVTCLIRQALERLIPAGWYVDPQDHIATADSKPAPDVTTIHGDTRHYTDRHPGPPNVALVAEVRAATLQRDRGL